MSLSTCFAETQENNDFESPGARLLLYLEKKLLGMVKMDTV